MTLTAKLATTRRNRASNEGDDTAGSGFPAAQTFRASGNLEQRFETGGRQDKILFVASWDDSIDGHIPAAGSMGLGVVIPNSFVVVRVYMDVEVVPVGPTNMFVSMSDDGDLVTSAAISGAPWSSAGIKHGNNADAGAINAASTVQGPFANVSAAAASTTNKEIAIGGTGATSSAGRVIIYVEGFLRPGLLTQGAVLA